MAKDEATSHVNLLVSGGKGPLNLDLVDIKGQS